MKRSSGCDAPQTPEGFARLGRNAALFSRTLRRFGLPVQPERTILFMRALQTVGVSSREDVKAAARSVFVRSPEQGVVFADVFDAFWERRVALEAQPGSAPSRPQTPDPVAGLPQTQRERSASGHVAALPAKLRSLGEDGEREPQAAAASEAAASDRAFSYSFAEGLYQKDFSQLSEADIDRAHELSKRQAWSLGSRLARRKAAGRGPAFDARRTLRSSLRRGGDIISLLTRARREQHRDIVLLCDISGSMDRYSRLLLRFVHTVRHAVGNVEAFVFGTRLTRITRQLRQRDIKDALDRVSETVPDWAGGTRIGESLQAFNTKWARRVLSRGAIVIIVSDGWDRGDAALLGAEMKRLQRSAFRLIWLNPLLGSSNYRPQTIGMKAALPFVDDFLPAHNLKSLFQLAELLQSIEDRRPARPQSAIALQDAR